MCRVGALEDMLGVYEEMFGICVWISAIYEYIEFERDMLLVKSIQATQQAPPTYIETLKQ